MTTKFLSQWLINIAIINILFGIIGSEFNYRAIKTQTFGENCNIFLNGKLNYSEKSTRESF